MLQTCYLFQKLLKKLLPPKYIIIFSLLIKQVTVVKLHNYTDIVTTIGRGNSAILVLLDTIDHDNLFCIL